MARAPGSHWCPPLLSLFQTLHCKEDPVRGLKGMLVIQFRQLRGENCHARGHVNAPSTSEIGGIGGDALCHVQLSGR